MTPGTGTGAGRRPADTTEAPWGIAPEEGGLPAGTHVGRLRLQVSDLDRTLDWYARVLGFRTVARDGAWAALAPLPEREGAEGPAEETSAAPAGGEAPTLIEVVARPGTRPLDGRARLGLYHFAVLLPDRASLGRFVRHLAGAGTRFGAADHLVSEALYLRDPDGLGVEVYADRPRERWRHEKRELRMTTDPLDLEDLARAGGTEPWVGMPPGTTIGHMHLHVGDLDRAARFYHDLLGLDKVVWSYPGALFLSAGGYHHHLGLNTWAAGSPPAGEDDARLLDWELVVAGEDQAERALRRLEAAGFAVEREDLGARVADPWGTRIRIVGSAQAAARPGTGSTGAPAS